MPDFAGPLFVLGLPRSGTKLVRDILNRSPDIAIPDFESHFIPYAIHRFGSLPKLSDPQRAKQFKKLFYGSNFAQNFLSADNGAYDSAMRAALRCRTWADILEPLFRASVPLDKRGAQIWGDKTPAYIGHIDLLNNTFPSSRIVHIVRDPRDHVLSVNKTWGKHVLRAAHRWNSCVLLSREQAFSLGSCYREVRFEQLLEDANTALTKLFTFLDCQFDLRFVKLERPSEFYGDARGSKEIQRSNRNKFESHFRKDEIRRIEQICLPSMNALGYEALYATHHRPLSVIDRKRLAVLDGLSMLRFNMRDKGYAAGLKYFIRYHRMGTWRK